MSQQKVDAYKAKKQSDKFGSGNTGRKKKKLSGEGIAAIIIGVVLLVGLAGSVGTSIYNQYVNYRDSRPDYTRTEMVVSDYCGIIDSTQ